ncbi:hypothetical protein [Streptomyces sp. NPDC020951]|uniref:hypothetical protein n=1 Tax=Streptomyces sp. NPDC020951 TaxID=3365104 RepID=UPI0037B81E54
MAADGAVGADLEFGPAEFVFDLFVALLDPKPQAVEADDQVVFSGNVAGSVVATIRRQGESGP